MFQDLNVRNAVFITLLNLFRNKKPKYFKIFQKHLKSLPFLSVTIQYKSMIDYVDRVLLNQNNN